MLATSGFARVHSNAFVFLDHAEFGVCEMMRSMTPLVLGVTLLAAMAGQTQADNFYFTFTDTAPYDGFNVPGTVTGEILGLTDNVANQQAAEVVVFSFPPIFGPYVATAPNTEIPVSNNLFSVSDVKIGNQIVEMITAFYFEAGVEDNVGLGGSPLDAMRPITGELFVDGAYRSLRTQFYNRPNGIFSVPQRPLLFSVGQWWRFNRVCGSRQLRLHPGTCFPHDARNGVVCNRRVWPSSMETKGDGIDRCNLSWGRPNRFSRPQRHRRADPPRKTNVAIRAVDRSIQRPTGFPGTAASRFGRARRRSRLGVPGAESVDSRRPARSGPEACRPLSRAERVSGRPRCS